MPNDALKHLFNQQADLISRVDWSGILFPSYIFFLQENEITLKFHKNLEKNQTKKKKKQINEQTNILSNILTYFHLKTKDSDTKLEDFIQF